MSVYNTVNELTPADIKVVGALGDSITVSLCMVIKTAVVYVYSVLLSYRLQWELRPASSGML